MYCKRAWTQSNFWELELCHYTMYYSNTERSLIKHCMCPYLHGRVRYFMEVSL